MTMLEMRPPQRRPDHAVIPDADTPWLQALDQALRVQGLTVERAPVAACAYAAYLSGASVVALAPAEDASLPDTWLSLCDRGAKILPASAILLPQERAAEASSWLEVGFDDVAVMEQTPADEFARRVVGRSRSRQMRRAMASVDALTGLPTLEVFTARLDPNIRMSSRGSVPMAVAVLDLDGLPAVERQRGRAGARSLLTDVARHLQAALRRSDTVARLGDERFGLILNQISAFEARRLMYTLWRSLSWSEETLGLVGELAGQVTFTAGVAVFPGDATDGPELLTRAEIALDVARATSQRRVLLYAETCGDSGVDVHGTDLRWHRVQSAAREEPE